MLFAQSIKKFASTAKILLAMVSSKYGIDAAKKIIEHLTKNAENFNRIAKTVFLTENPKGFSP